MIERDKSDAREILKSDLAYRGKVWEISKDSFELNSELLVRDYLRHPGAVAIVAVNEESEILLISQYRHPVGLTMIEIPAGLLDHEAEDPLLAAQRELREESGYVASDWSVLVDFCTSPGSSSEAVRIYLAENLSYSPDPAYLRSGEESEIQIWFKSGEDLVQQVLNGEIQSPTAVAGILAWTAAKTRNHRKSANAEWPIRDHLLHNKRVFKF